MFLNTSLTSASSAQDSFLVCMFATTGFGAFSAYSITSTLLLIPISILVIHEGLRRPTAFHQSSIILITYHSMAIELLNLVGCIIYVFGNLRGNTASMMIALYLISMAIPGQNLFQTLTCVDRYLAVIHPVTYLHLKRTTGVRITYACLAFVWLTCLLWLVNTRLHLPELPVKPYLVLFSLCLVTCLLCSICVLHVLIRPGPGDGGNRVAQSKQRAFNSIMAIQAVLVLRFVGSQLCLILPSFFSLAVNSYCVLVKNMFWFCLPSALVLPLLLLHRGGKLKCISIPRQ